MSCMRFTLTDQGNSTAQLEGEVHEEHGQLWLTFQGYGEYSSAEGYGSPLAVELYEGRLRLIVWPDVQRQDPDIIDLEHARESNRTEDGPGG